MASRWNDAAVHTLKKLWAAGCTADMIAVRLGGDFTRNAVVGKVHRLGLSGDGTVRAARIEAGGVVGGSFREINRKRNNRFGKPKLAVKPTTPAPAKPQRHPWRAHPVAIEDRAHEVPTGEAAAAAAVAEGVADRGKLITNDELAPHHCRWIYGDVKVPGWGFCGADKVPGLPYCRDHVIAAHDTPEAGQRVLAKAAIREIKRAAARQTEPA